MTWRKSSRSGSATNCVEVRHDLVALRDSKHPTTPLTLPVAAVRALIVEVKR